jgi:hypothetical protein
MSKNLEDIKEIGNSKGFGKETKNAQWLGSTWLTLEMWRLTLEPLRLSLETLLCSTSGHGSSPRRRKRLPWSLACSC